MEVSEVKQRLLTDFFTYYPMGGALYDKNGALIDINKSLNEKFPFTNEAGFLLNNLFRTDLLTDLQKQYLRGGSVVSGSLPVPYSIIPSMNENREILGYTLLLTGNPAVGQEAAGYDRELKELPDMSRPTSSKKRPMPVLRGASFSTPGPALRKSFAEGKRPILFRTLSGLARCRGAEGKGTAHCATFLSINIPGFCEFCKPSGPSFVKKVFRLPFSPKVWYNETGFSGQKEESFMSILRTIAMFVYLFGYMIVHYGVLRRAECALAAGDMGTVEQIINKHIPHWSRGILKVTGAQLVVGVELNRDAVRDAIGNAKHNGVKNARFFAADATAWICEAAAAGERADVIFMDPPREGSTPQFIESVARMAPRRVVYVSCNPETMARDLALLTKKGYRAEGFTPVDMFPNSEHIEVVCALSRQEQRKQSRR